MNRSASEFPPLPAADILQSATRGVWFSAVGEPLTESENEELRTYLRALNLGDIAIGQASDWHEAKRIAESKNWSRAWWDAERDEERRLLQEAFARYGNDAVMKRLTQLMEDSSEMFLGPAAVACTRAGVADPALARSAAGAASQCVHQYGLASLLSVPDDHFFATKFRLFLAGRWPLSLNEGRFYIF
ncbi:MAG TPA: hypothetical protein VK629_17890 [Steroidobacteraceae bacterium]|nr:hypothetical protein [Steroidobacteraceae bacterium]